jgi:ABC-type sugar transport system ATPase subunit/ribose/xylose/arabinose/galactoside ABC-type transport system permease subunit
MEDVLLAVEGIDKRFPGVLALHDVSFEIQPGEIHGLVGENGAGKSTLMRILAGVYQPDRGSIRLHGDNIRFRDPAQARQAGISMVYQDTRLVGDLDVAQNVWLAREPTRFGLVNRKAIDSDTAAILAQLGMSLPTDRQVSDLTVAERQIVEIARALSNRAVLLILDEPTSSLDTDEVRRLFGILCELQRGGTAIIFISHRLPEVLELTSRVTVLKDGEVVDTLPTNAATEAELVSMMVGRSMSVAFPPRAERVGEVLLEVQHLSSRGAFSDVSFSVARGEVVGLGGIEGNGQREILRALFGLLPTSGNVWLAGKALALKSPADAIGRKAVYLSNDRRGESLMLPHSIRENLALPHLGSWSRAGVISRIVEQLAVYKAIERLSVRTPSSEQPVELLSGGNQQKVVIGRWLLAEPQLYIFDEPTQGVDVGTKLELYRIIRQLTSEGAAVLILSTELLELLGLCDRILVVAHGRIVDEMAGAEATEERVIGSAVTAKRQETLPSVNATSTKPKSSGWRYSSAVIVTLLVVALALFTQTQSPYFLAQRNLSNLAIQITPLALVAMGQMAVILVGGIDLSVGQVVSLTTAIASFVLVGDNVGSLLLGVLVCLVVGGVIGTINGVMIRYLRLPDLIATLASYSIVFGLALVVRPSPGGQISYTFSDAVTARLGNVPIAAIVVLILFIIGEVLLMRSRIGSALYATGSNREAAFVAGVPVQRVRMAAYIFCSVTSVLAGFIVGARIGGGDPQVGAQFTLASVTAVVVGGTSIFGGRGSLIGTLTGCVLILSMQSALNQLHVSAYYQYIWVGALTLFAVAIYSVRAGGIDWRRILSRRTAMEDTRQK